MPLLFCGDFLREAFFLLRFREAGFERFLALLRFVAVRFLGDMIGERV